MDSQFMDAYERLLARWPLPVERVHVPGPYGDTHVAVTGPSTGPPLVLLHGDGATSAVWFATVGEFAATHRIYAVDRLGGAGAGRRGDRDAATREQLMQWLEGVLDGLALDKASLCGHSYGAWMALTFALRSPARMDSLVLLDPTDCFSGLALEYRLRAIPLLLRPTAERARAFLGWETGGRTVDADWLDVFALGAQVKQAKVVLPRRPRDESLQQLPVPVLVVLAGASRAHHSRKVAATAERLLPDAQVMTIARATHHTMPTEDAEVISAAISRFLNQPRDT